MCNAIIRPITAGDNPQIAKIIRSNLKQFHLDIPGTVYFDKGLDALSEYYNALPEKRQYFIVTDENHTVIGGGGFAEFAGFDGCAELQKLYLTDAVKGRGLGKKLMQIIEDAARAAGYQSLYLETHTNLETAIHLYEKLGFQRIDKPEAVVHSTMNRFYLKQISASSPA